MLTLRQKTQMPLKMSSQALFILKLHSRVGGFPVFHTHTPKIKISFSMLFRSESSSPRHRPCHRHGHMHLRAALRQ